MTGPVHEKTTAVDTCDMCRTASDWHSIAIVVLYTRAAITFAVDVNGLAVEAYRHVVTVTHSGAAPECVLAAKQVSI